MSAEAAEEAAAYETEVKRVEALKQSARTAATREALAASSTGLRVFVCVFLTCHVLVCVCVCAVGKYMAKAPKRPRDEE